MDAHPGLPSIWWWFLWDVVQWMLLSYSSFYSCFGRRELENRTNISPALWASQCLLVDKGLSSHGWDAASKLGVSRLSNAWMPWPEDRPWMLSGEMGSTFGSGLGLILWFLIVGRKERLLLVQAAAQEGSAQPKD